MNNKIGRRRPHFVLRLSLLKLANGLSTKLKNDAVDPRINAFVVLEAWLASSWSGAMDGRTISII